MINEISSRLCFNVIAEPEKLAEFAAATIFPKGHSCTSISEIQSCAEVRRLDWAQAFRQQPSVLSHWSRRNGVNRWPPLGEKPLWINASAKAATPFKHGSTVNMARVAAHSLYLLIQLGWMSG